MVSSLQVANFALGVLIVASDPNTTQRARLLSQSIQDKECTDVTDQMDCTVIKKCDWDYLSNECHWRCNFLADQTSCTSKGAAPVPPKKRTRGCSWLAKPSAITGKRCDYDCEQRSGQADCTQSPSCMWTGKSCKIGCVNYVKSECAMVEEEGFCVWERKASGSESCKQACRPRPDRDTCDPTGNRNTCEWDDCKRKCLDTTKVALPDAKWKRTFQLESDCMDRGVNSRWYWDYQCTGKHSHCYIEDYKTKNAVFTKGNVCDFATFDLTHCLPDCEALNKLALDPTYKDSEPTFSTSLAKAEHFCKQDKASCAWNNGKCEWKQSCDIKWPSQIITTKPAKEQQEMVSFMRMDMCDIQTCTAARSGGGSSPIDLHGKCQDAKVVTAAGRLRKERCFLKCELRTSEADCISQGQGGRLADTYKGKTCGPLKLAADGSIDEAKGTLQLPQECVGFCRWASGKCLTACEFRSTKSECTGTCKWDDNAATGVKEYGGLPDLIPCTGEPSTPLYDASTVAKNAADKVKTFSEKGGAGFVGPVSTCILAANLAGTSQNCYSSVTLALDTRYEKVYVAPSPGAPAPPPTACVQDPALKIAKSMLKVTATLTDGDLSASDKGVFLATNTTLQDAFRAGFAETMSLTTSPGYTITKDMIGLTIKKVTIVDKTITFDAEFTVTLAAGHRPSSLNDQIIGNSARKVKGLLEVPEDGAMCDFCDFFKQHTWTEKFKKGAFGDDAWKWDFAVKVHSLTRLTAAPAPTPPVLPKPSPGPTPPSPTPKPSTPPSPTPKPSTPPSPAPNGNSNGNPNGNPNENPNQGSKTTVTTTTKAVDIKTAAVKIDGNLVMTVPDPAKFGGDKAAQDAVKAGIAAAHDVPPSSVVIEVSVTTRRLAPESSERLLAAGSVNVKYTITLPESETAAKKEAVKQKAQTLTIPQLSKAIETKVQAEKGTSYAIAVTKKATPVVKLVAPKPKETPSTGSASPARKAESITAIMALAVVALLRLSLV